MAPSCAYGYVIKTVFLVSTRNTGTGTMRKWPTQVSTVAANVGRELSLLKMAINMANADYPSFFLWNELEPRCQQRQAGSLELSLCEISAWISNEIPYFQWNIITHSCANTNVIKKKLGHRWVIKPNRFMWIWLPIHFLNTKLCLIFLRKLGPWKINYAWVKVCANSNVSVL